MSQKEIEKALGNIETIAETVLSTAQDAIDALAVERAALRELQEQERADLLSARHTASTSLPHEAWCEVMAAAAERDCTVSALLLTCLIDAGVVSRENAA